MFILRRQSQSNNQKGNVSVDQDENGNTRTGGVNELRAALGPLAGRSLKYCTDSCLKRYLAARSWNVDKAKKMLEGELEWRASFKPEEIRWHEVAHVGTKGLISRANFRDRSGRPVIIVRLGVVGKITDDNFWYLVYMLENADLNLGEDQDQDQISWLQDYSGWSLRTNFPLKMTRDCLNVMQNHYPERLSVAIIYNPPRIFEPFWKVCLLIKLSESENLYYILQYRVDSVKTCIFIDKINHMEKIK